VLTSFDVVIVVLFLTLVSLIVINAVTKPEVIITDMLRVSEKLLSVAVSLEH